MRTVVALPGLRKRFALGFFFPEFGQSSVRVELRVTPRSLAGLCVAFRHRLESVVCASAAWFRSEILRVKDLSLEALLVVSRGGAWVRRLSGCVSISRLSQWRRIVSVAARVGSAWYKRWLMVAAHDVNGGACCRRRLFFSLSGAIPVFQWYFLAPSLEFLAVWPCALLSHPT